MHGSPREGKNEEISLELGGDGRMKDLVWGGSRGRILAEMT